MWGASTNGERKIAQQEVKHTEIVDLVATDVVVWTMELCTSACSSLTEGHLVGFPSDGRKGRNVVDKRSGGSY